LYILYDARVKPATQGADINIERSKDVVTGTP